MEIHDIMRHFKKSSIVSNQFFLDLKVFFGNLSIWLNSSKIILLAISGIQSKYNNPCFKPVSGLRHWFLKVVYWKSWKSISRQIYTNYFCYRWVGINEITVWNLHHIVKLSLYTIENYFTGQWFKNNIRIENFNIKETKTKATFVIRIDLRFKSNYIG